MPGPVAMLGLIALFGAVFFAMVVSLMAALNRFCHRYAAIGAGGLALVYLVVDWASLAVFCAEPPMYVPPTPEAAALGSDGSMRFNCDAPFGGYIRLYLYFVAPALILGLATLVAYHVRRLRIVEG